MQYAPALSWLSGRSADRGFHDKSVSASSRGLFDLTGQVQQQRACRRSSLNQRADGIARPAPVLVSATTGKTPVGVRPWSPIPPSPRAGRSGFFPLADGIGDRQVVNRNDAIYGFNVILLSVLAMASPTVIISLIAHLLSIPHQWLTLLPSPDKCSSAASGPSGHWIPFAARPLSLNPQTGWK